MVEAAQDGRVNLKNESEVRELRKSVPKVLNDNIIINNASY